MGYLNNVTGHREDLLASRVIVKHGNFALLTPDDLVKNIIPGSENCDMIVPSTSELNASLISYLVILHQSDSNRQGFGGEGIETFLYVISGNITVKAEGKTFVLNEDGYLYRPPGSSTTFVNAQAEDSRILLYKRRYVPVEGHTPWLVPGNASELKRIHYEGMDDAIPLNFLFEELGFDMNMHVLSFVLGASHGCIETHVQEHGVYILSGQGVYSLNNNWIPVRKDDYIFISAYSSQADYGVGRGETFSYIYSKDYDRDVGI